MNKPFEDILGNCDELKIIEYLLPLEEIEFNITEIVDKFVEWKLLKSRTHFL